MDANWFGFGLVLHWFTEPVLLPSRRFMADLRSLSPIARVRPARARFHRVQRRVCRAQERIHLFAIFGINSNPDADRQLWLLAIIRKTVANTPGY